MTVPMWLDPDDQKQRILDSFYWSNGPCCAGCDWWVHITSLTGECRRSAPVSASERYGMMGITGCSLPMEAGHVLTYRNHHCREFKDDFDWSSLSPHYLRSIGAPAPTTGGATDEP